MILANGCALSISVLQQCHRTARIFPNTINPFHHHFTLVQIVTHGENLPESVVSLIQGGLLKFFVEKRRCWLLLFPDL